MYAKEHCPYYAEIFRDRGFNPKAIKSTRDIITLPILTKEIIREKINDLKSTEFGDKLWEKSTGGSTGQPLHFYYTKESYEWRVAISKRGYTWAGAWPGSRQAYIWGSPIGDLSRIRMIKEKLHHLVDRQRYFNSFNFGEQMMSKCLAELQRYQPHVIIGFTNPLYHLALHAEKGGRIGFRPHAIICAAEKMFPFQREVMERVFRCPVFNTYGCREFMLIASECERHEGLHVNIENLVVEIIKDDGTHAREGEAGRIIVTDLHNYGMPFIRYEIGDIGVFTDRQCSCGRGLPIIEDVVGRSLDMLKTPEGKMVSGEFFPHLMKEFKEVVKFQVIQETLEDLQIMMVTSDELSDEALRRLDREVRRVFGNAIKVSYSRVDDIPLTSSGKYRVTISRIG